MDKHDKESKPWEASFSSEEPAQKYSRSANRRKSRQVSVIVGLFVTIIMILSFIPIYNYLQGLNKPNNTTAISALSSAKTTTSISKVDKVTKSEKKAAQKASSEKKAASASEAKAKSESVAKAKSASLAKSSSAASSASASSSSSTGTTAVFSSGTLYSFAVSHDTTPEALYTLNSGLTASNYTSYYGKSLRVK